MRCTADQLIVVSGAQQAVDLAARLLLDPGDNDWMEEPGYRDQARRLRAAGAHLLPVEADAEGLSLRAGLNSRQRQNGVCHRFAPVSAWRHNVAGTATRIVRVGKAGSCRGSWRMTMTASIVTRADP